MRNLLKDTTQNDDGNQPRGNAQGGSIQALDGRADADVANVKGEITSCDIPFHGGISLEQFNADYLRLTREAVRSCINHDVTDSMVIGTSALTKHQIDRAVGMYSGIYNNPFLIWGRYRTISRYMPQVVQLMILVVAQALVRPVTARVVTSR